MTGPLSAARLNTIGRVRHNPHCTCDHLRAWHFAPGSTDDECYYPGCRCRGFTLRPPRKPDARL